MKNTEKYGYLIGMTVPEAVEKNLVSIWWAYNKHTGLEPVYVITRLGDTMILRARTRYPDRKVFGLIERCAIVSQFSHFFETAEDAIAQQKQDLDGRLQAARNGLRLMEKEREDWFAKELGLLKQAETGLLELGIGDGS